MGGVMGVWWGEGDYRVAPLWGGSRECVGRPLYGVVPVGGSAVGWSPLVWSPWRGVVCGVAP